MIVLYPNRTARSVLLHFESYKIFFWLLEKNTFLYIFTEKMNILLNKSIFEPFWSLNRHTFPPKAIKNNYQSNIWEYAGFFRMVEKYVYWKVMKESLILFAITKNPGMKQRLIVLINCSSKAI